MSGGFGVNVVERVQVVSGQEPEVDALQGIHEVREQSKFRSGGEDEIRRWI